MPDLKKLAEIIEPEAKALGFDLVRVAWFDRGAEGSDEPTLQVMAERPDTRQLVIDDCAAYCRIGFLICSTNLIRSKRPIGWR